MAVSQFVVVVTTGCYWLLPLQLQSRCEVVLWLQEIKLSYSEQQRIQMKKSLFVSSV